MGERREKPFSAVRGKISSSAKFVGGSLRHGHALPRPPFLRSHSQGEGGGRGKGKASFGSREQRRENEFPLSDSPLNCPHSSLSHSSPIARLLSNPLAEFAVAISERTTASISRRDTTPPGPPPRPRTDSFRHYCPFSPSLSSAGSRRYDDDNLATRTERANELVLTLWWKRETGELKV